MWLVNPAFVVPNWNDPKSKFRFILDGKTLEPGDDYRFGFEASPTGKNLIIWLDRIIDLNEREEHAAAFAIKPTGQE